MRRITNQLIVQIDNQRNTSFRRQIDMAVEAITASIDPVYYVQFWRDMTVYGLKMSIMYLDGFVKSKGYAKVDFAAQFCELSEARQELETLAGDFHPRTLSFVF